MYLFYVLGQNMDLSNVKTKPPPPKTSAVCIMFDMFYIFYFPQLEQSHNKSRMAVGKARLAKKIKAKLRAVAPFMGSTVHKLGIQIRNSKLGFNLVLST